MADVVLGDFSLERMVRAVEKVRERLLRAVRALDGVGVPYAVVDDQAVVVWVSRVDEAAVRGTPNIDILIRRDDLERVTSAMATAAFVHQHFAGTDYFLDGPEAKDRNSVRIIFAGEKVRPEYLFANPELDESEAGGHFPVVTLDALVRMLLTSFRLKDRVHLRDMLEVELIDASWKERLPAELAKRLQELFDTPNG